MEEAQKERDQELEEEKVIVNLKRKSNFQRKPWKRVSGEFAIT